MEPEDLNVDWQQVEADLLRARATLPPGESFEDEILWYDMFLQDESTFGLACERLEAYGKSHPVSREFWLALRDAAVRMGMHERAKDYERQGGAG
jgi:hypothetical protein